MLGLILRLLGGGKGSSRKDKKKAAREKQKKLFRERMAFEHAMDNVDAARGVTEPDKDEGLVNARQKLDAAKDRATNEKSKNDWQKKVAQKKGSKKSGSHVKGINSMRNNIHRSRARSRSLGAQKGLC